MHQKSFDIRSPSGPVGGALKLCRLPSWIHGSIEKSKGRQMGGKQGTEGEGEM